jgi:NADPH-dependent 2,4-dienoyl-CoA reductase/sulfur reductase-like enzyme
MANTPSTKIVIVGGVAGGMSCAARARRLSESARITVFERGPYPSFANCGLPYHIGGEIADRSKLIVQTQEKLEANLAIDVRTGHEALSIDRAAKTVRVRRLADGVESDESYDYLVLSPGASPIVPPLAGLDLPGVFTLRNIPDMDRILQWLDKSAGNRAVVVGGGYIGLEVAEQLRHRGLQVTTAEASPQIMAPLDPEWPTSFTRKCAPRAWTCTWVIPSTGSNPQADAPWEKSC